MKETNVTINVTLDKNNIPENIRHTDTNLGLVIFSFKKKQPRTILIIGVIKYPIDAS